MNGQIILAFMEPENINCSISTVCRLWWVLTVKNSYKNITQTPVYKSILDTKALVLTLP